MLAQLIRCLALLAVLPLAAAPIPDAPFWQDVAVRLHHAPELTNAIFKKLCVDKENVVYVLTDQGVARVFDDTLALDRSYRPLAGKVPLDITISPEGDLYYLFEDRWLSNGKSGKPSGITVSKGAQKICVMPDGLVVLSTSGGVRLYSPEGQPRSGMFDLFIGVPKFTALGLNDFVAFDRFSLSHHTWSGGEMFVPGWRTKIQGITCFSQSAGEIVVGTTNGFTTLDAANGLTIVPLTTNLPSVNITSMIVSEGGVWFGTLQGAFFKFDHTLSRYATPAAPGIEPPRFRYYAGKRWLRDDHVVDLAVDHDGHLWVLTQTGLNKIEFRQTTLAAKADWFHRKSRRSPHFVQAMWPKVVTIMSSSLKPNRFRAASRSFLEYACGT